MRTFAAFSPSGNADNAAVYACLRDIINKRQEDVARLSGIEGLNASLRKVNKIPAASTDIVGGVDNLGDFNYDASYLYIVVNSGGALAWRRITLGVF